MNRDLSKSLKAQKKVEKKTESKFGHYKENKKEDPKKTSKTPMIKLTTTIEQSNWEYLQSETMRRSQERGKMLNISQVLREILQEHKNI